MAGRSLTVVLALTGALALAGCGGGDDSGGGGGGEEAGAPTRLEGVPPGQEEGAQLVAQSGCLGCHRIGAQGNEAPGPALTDVGARMPGSAIRDVLVRPTAPMPSFAELPERDLDAIVAYLVALR